MKYLTGRTRNGRLAYARTNDCDIFVSHNGNTVFVYSAFDLEFKRYWSQPSAEELRTIVDRYVAEHMPGHKRVGRRDPIEATTHGYSYHYQTKEV